jgi:geranylgeranyl pyrophosphate synthase
MGQILLNIDSPVSLLKGIRTTPVEKTVVLNDVETLRAQVLPYLLSLIEKKTSILSDLHLSNYVTKVVSRLERAWFTKITANMLAPSMSVPIPLLVAVELRYLYDLILDDIADCSTERCGVPTLHLQVGIPKAMYLAEILMGIAIECLGEALETANVSQQLSIMAIKSWGRKNTLVSIAQYQDLVYEYVSLDRITPDMSLDLIDGTTAQDLANCFFLGGLITSASTESIDRLHRIGQCIGMLMQIRDDLLDYVNDANIINKEPLLDFKNSRKKVPLVVAFHHASDLEKQEILALMAQTDHSPEDITRIKQIILNPIALAYQSNLCHEFIRQIDENLAALGANGQAAETLQNFVHKYLKLDI